MKKAIILSLLFVLSINSEAQELWSLERCILHALEHNLNIQQAENNITLAEINQTQNRHQRYPSLNANTGLSSNFGRSIDPITNDFISTNFLSNNVGISTGITVFNGFRIANSIKQSDIDLSSAELNLEQNKRDIALQVANTYLNVLFAEENLSIAKSQLENDEQQLIQIQKLIASGMRPANESLTIEAQVALDNQNIITAENNITIALLGLKQLLRLDPDVVMQVQAPENIDVLLDPDALTFEEVYASALKSQPSVQASLKNIESSKLGEEIAEASRYPSVTFGGNVNSNYSNQGRTLDGFNTTDVDQNIVINGIPATITTTQQIPNFVDNPYFGQIEENLFYGFGLNVNVPIYNNYSTRANIERAKLNTINTVTQNELLKDQLKTTIQQALADARASKRKLSASEKSLNAQQASFDNAKKSYELGSINNFEFVGQQNALAQSKVNFLISKYEYVFAAKIIDFYMGKPIKL